MAILVVDGDIRSGFTFYLLKKEKKYCFVPAKGTFYLSTDFCITVQAPNTGLFLIIKGRIEQPYSLTGSFLIILRQ